MRFAVVAALAGAALAHQGDSQSTVSTTETYTITSCAASVTNCPAESTKVTSTVYPVTTSTVYSTRTNTVTSCAPTVTNCPAHSTVTVVETIPVSTTVCPVTETQAQPTKYGNTTAPGVPTTPAGKPTTYAQTTVLATSVAAPACPTYSVKTISTSVTTVVPTVIYETVSIPCPTTTKAPAPPAASSGFPAGNATTTKPPVTISGAGSNVIGSLFLAVAGVAAAALL